MKNIIFIDEILSIKKAQEKSKELKSLGPTYGELIC
jgi:hypothetical protein